MPTDVRLLRLLQLASPALPVGGFSFSQGLEWAVDTGWVTDESSCEDWIATVLAETLGKLEAPLVMRLQTAANDKDRTSFDAWNQYAIACRETKELRDAELVMGQAMKRLLKSVVEDTALLDLMPKRLSYIAGFALAASAWHIEVETTLQGYLWSWLENQCAAATKLIPLGQTSTQRLLLKLSQAIPDLVDQALLLEDEEMGGTLPYLTLASAWHEEQYSRLFRS